MTENEIMSTVNAALAEEFELDPSGLTPEAGIYEDLGLDSLDAVDMVIVLENAFGFKLRDEQALRAIRTLKDLYAFIAAKQQELGTPGSDA
jgi:acyl carrier protein